MTDLIQRLQDATGNEPFGQDGICTQCGDDSPAVDEATELCEMCYEHIMGPNEDARTIAALKAHGGNDE